MAVEFPGTAACQDCGQLALCVVCNDGLRAHREALEAAVKALSRHGFTGDASSVMCLHCGGYTETREQIIHGPDCALALCLRALGTGGGNG